MSDFFMDHRQTAARDLNMLSIKDYRDIHLATLQILEKTGVFVEDQQALEVFGSCGASVDKKSKIVDELEQEVGKPVVVSNQAMFWDTLRLAGIEDKIDGYGRLFRER